jgi:hypothetical protein
LACPKFVLHSPPNACFALGPQVSQEKLGRLSPSLRTSAPLRPDSIPRSFHETVSRMIV